MKEKDLSIRIAALEDAEEILEIYGYYVKNTAITFEYEVPSVGEFRRRMENTLKKYPFIVAERNQEILGYAYSGLFIGRAAYDWSAETTVYLKTDSRKMGVGGKLYRRLEDICGAQNIINLNACIACPETEDEYLTKNSVQFHEHLGYRMAGKFYKCGYKFGRWYDMVWMEKIIGEHKDVPEPVIPFPNLREETLQQLKLL